MYDLLSGEQKDAHTRMEYAVMSCKKVAPDQMFRTWAAWMCPVTVIIRTKKDEFGEPILDKNGFIQKQKDYSLTLNDVAKHMAKPKRLGELSSKEQFAVFCRANGLTPSSWSLYPVEL